MEKNSKDKVLEDSASDSEKGLECETCGISFESIKAFETHMKGKKHSKKIAQEKLVSKLLQYTGEAESDDEAEELHCSVCDKYFTGHVSYLTHLKGNVHAKFLKKEKLIAKMADTTGVLGNDEGSEEDGISQRLFARCPPCHKEFTGPESFAAHLKSSAHKKRVQVSKLTIDAQGEGAKSSDDDDGVFASCKVCQKTFGGPIPFHMHMASKVHKKNLEKQKVAEDMKKVCDKYDPATGFVCTECKKSFVDPLMFKNHLANNSHEKQKAKNALKEFLSQYPEILFVAPFGDAASDSEGSETANPNQGFYLICKLCQMSFSGPESAQDHVKSKKHLSLKEKKRVMKLLKDQEKQLKKKASEVKPHKTPDHREVKHTNGVTNTNRVSSSKDNEGDDFELL